MTIGSILIIAALVVGLLWLLRGGAARPTPGPESEWDREELEAAEREVQHRGGSGAEPGDEQTGDDWGPGAPRPRDH